MYVAVWVFFLAACYCYMHFKCLPSDACRVNFQFQHNVCGRSIYAQGTVDAVLFLAKKVSYKYLHGLYAVCIR
jgi:hypothetical protein